MPQSTGRYRAITAPQLAPGWTLKNLTPPSRLFGANGLRTGPDGRLYVAQVSGSQISAVDPKTGAVEAISPKGGDIIAPDDLAFDASGNLYATEVMDGRVSVRSRAGQTRVLRDDLPAANGITVHQGRLFVGECRIGGRILELDLDGGEPRVLLADVPMPNAMEVGPDGLLYFPVMGTNEIWRIHPDGGAVEKVAGDLGVPDSVKFDARGQIVSTQVHSGQVLRIDPRSGARSLLAQLDPGLDNLSFIGERLFVSSFSGQITEIGADGRISPLLAGGLNGPLDVAVDASGALFVADGAHLFQLQNGALQSIGMMFSPGFPGYIRGICAVGHGEFVVATAGGQVARYRPAQGESEVLAQGFDQLYGIDASSDGRIVVAELGTGRLLAIRGGQTEVLASGLRDPVGVALAPDGRCLVSEAAGGRMVSVAGGKTETLVDGLQRPHGVLIRDSQLFVVDAGAQSLIAVDLKTRQRSIIAEHLPVGVPPGVVAKPLRGFPPFSGPMGPFAGITAGADGTLYLSADAEGSILALQRG
ncbi:MAG TPA: SMP-30/gluconolactonase/LRE family protein [Fontimonas sp.]